MSLHQPGEILAAARREIAEEQRRAAIDAEKARLLRSRWWHRFIPLITITWRTK